MDNWTEKLTCLELGPGWVRFPVDEVEPARTLLEEVKTHEAIATLLEGQPEASSDYTRLSVAGVRHQPLLEAVHRAYADHRPLVMSPDHVWLTIVQGFAAHVNANPEQLRSSLVGHKGRGQIRIEVPASELPLGSPENDWAKAVIEPLSAALKAAIDPDLHELLVPTFSTTGPLERTAFQVALLEAHQPYFDYVVYLVCGIPWIKLEGQVDDWQELRDRAQRLRGYDLDWWLDPLAQVLDQFVQAASGAIDTGFWRRIYKIHKRYGGVDVNGWLLALVPYLKHGVTHRLTIRNPILADPTKDFSADGFSARGVAHDSLPTGISQVRVSLQGPNLRRSVDVIAGFVGIEQSHRDLSLRPQVGWAVRPSSGLDSAIQDLRLDHEVAAPPDLADFKKMFNEGVSTLPRALVQFYSALGGATIRLPSGRWARLYPLDKLVERIPPDSYGPTWIEFGELHTGERLAIRPPNRRAPPASVALLSGQGERHLADDLGAALGLLLSDAPLPDLGPPQPLPDWW